MNVPPCVAVGAVLRANSVNAMHCCADHELSQVLLRQFEHFKTAYEAVELPSVCKRAPALDADFALSG